MRRGGARDQRERDEQVPKHGAPYRNRGPNRDHRRARWQDARVTLSSQTVRLRYRAPYDWDAIIGYLRPRAIDGIERVDGEGASARYARTVAHDGARGHLELAHEPAHSSIVVALHLASDAPAFVEPILARVRRVLDLDADVASITAHLSRDPLLATLVARRPGLRVPGGWDGFELAVRAVLGQQVTIVAARRLAGQLVATCGASIDGPGLSRIFPTAAQVADADLSALGMPNARRETLRAIARAALADPQLFASSSSVEATVERLRAIRGVGDWTAHYIALRAAREPDAFPASDVGLLRAVAEDGVRPTPRALLARAERWRPWRAYAAQHLWSADAER